MRRIFYFYLINKKGRVNTKMKPCPKMKDRKENVIKNRKKFDKKLKISQNIRTDFWHCYEEARLTRNSKHRKIIYCILCPTFCLGKW